MESNQSKRIFIFLTFLACMTRYIDGTTGAIASTTPGIASTTPGIASTTPGIASTTPGIASTSTAIANASAAINNTTDVISNTTTTPVADYYAESYSYDYSLASGDYRLVNILSVFYPSLSNTIVANVASSNSSVWAAYVNNITEAQWLENCDAANDYYSLMEDMIVYGNDNNSYVTYNRLNKVLGCKTDCDFSVILSVPSNFTSYSNGDTTSFANNAVMNLPADAASLCQYSFDSFSEYAFPNASLLLSNINFISQVDPEAFESFSDDDILSLSEKISSSDLSLTDAQMEALGSSIPENVPLDNISGLANAVPMGCFDSTSPSTLVGLLNKFANLDDSRKIYISQLITSSLNATLILQLLNGTTDQTIIDTVPGYLFDQLNIDISSIPAGNVPESYKMEYGAKQLSESCVSAITSLSLLSKALPSITSDSLTCITDSLKIATIFNILQASLQYGVSLTSIQRSSMFASLVSSLQVLSNSKNATVYLSLLNRTVLQSIYPLFIEADANTLSAFANLSSFSVVINKISNMTTTDCCSYSPAGFENFAAYAVGQKFNYSKLSSADLDKIGPCLYSHLPLSNLKLLDPRVFVNKFSLLGNIYQPHSTEIPFVTQLITEYAQNSTLVKSQNTLFFSTLSSLALFYPYQTYSANLTQWQTIGGSLLNTVQKAYDPSLSSNDMCQLALNSTDTSTLESLLSSLSTQLVNQIFPQSKKRITVNYTCDKLKQLGKGVTALNSTQLGLITTTEFKKCQSTLGAITSWTASQLSTLASLATKAYGTITAINDQNVASLNSICQGFTESQLAQLNLTTTTSINALGSLNKWTSSQLSALATPIANYISTYLKNNITSKFMVSSGNLLCSIPNSMLASTYVSSSNFLQAVGAHSKINVQCSNIANWYSFAKSLTRYSSKTITTGRKKRATTTVALSQSGLTELGSVVAGITPSDLSTLPASYISSISATAFQYMPAATVNTLTTAQLNGLSATQLAGLVNSPYYSSFSSSIKSGLSSLASNSKATVSTTTTTNNGLITNACYSLIFISLTFIHVL